MAETTPAPHPTDWLTIPDVAEHLGTTPGAVRRLLEDFALLASRRDGVLKVPSVFLASDGPLPSLRGTAIVLHDAGLDVDESIDWILGYEDALGNAPIESLLAGRKAEVRRVAQVL